MKNFFIALLILAGFQSCGSGTGTNNLPQRQDSSGVGADSATQGSLNETTPSGMDTGKLDGTWYLVAALPSDTAAGKVPTIIFNSGAKNFTGNTGCNNMRGSFTSSDSTIQISEQIISTKMACPGYNEDGFLKSLPKANNFRFENNMLILLMDATEVSRWSREPVKATIKTA